MGTSQTKAKQSDPKKVCLEKETPKPISKTKIALGMTERAPFRSDSGKKQHKKEAMSKTTNIFWNFASTSSKPKKNMSSKDKDGSKDKSTKATALTQKSSSQGNKKILSSFLNPSALMSKLSFANSFNLAFDSGRLTSRGVVTSRQKDKSSFKDKDDQINTERKKRSKVSIDNMVYTSRKKSPGSAEDHKQMLAKSKLNRCPEEVIPGLAPAKRSIASTDSLSCYGVNTTRGILRDYNEDKVSVILKVQSPLNKHGPWPKVSFFGVSLCNKALRWSWRLSLCRLLKGSATFLHFPRSFFSR